MLDFCGLKDWRGPPLLPQSENMLKGWGEGVSEQFCFVRRICPMYYGNEGES
jgi:hypothetical protein